ncbi:MAG: hypothetical protein J4G13_05060 [Dehalococcoidia bacterium]|nr:hypothetical protein [Dehalococcoidia bacterium]
MLDVPPGFVPDFLRLIGFMAAVGVVAVAARQALARWARRCRSDGLAGFVSSAPGTFLLVILSFVVCLMIFLAAF